MAWRAAAAGMRIWVSKDKGPLPRKPFSKEGAPEFQDTTHEKGIEYPTISDTCAEAANGMTKAGSLEELLPR